MELEGYALVYINSFIYSSLHRYLLSSYMPDSVLTAGYTTLNPTDVVPVLRISVWAILLLCIHCTWVQQNPDKCREAERIKESPEGKLSYFEHNVRAWEEGVL